MKSYWKCQDNPIILAFLLATSSLSGCTDLHSWDWLERRQAVEDVTDQAILAEVATKDIDDRVRLTAVDRLTDQVTLARLATEDKDGFVREAAVLRLSNQTVLKKLALKDRDARIRAAAVAGLTDQALLLQRANNDSDYGVRLTAIANMTDQTLLARLQSHDVHDPTLGVFGPKAKLHITEIARLRRFLNDPVVERQLGKSKVIVRHSYEKKREYDDPKDLMSGHQLPYTVYGESVRIEVRPQKLQPSIGGYWKSPDLPKSVKVSRFWAGGGGHLLTAPIDVGPLMEKLLPGFQPETIPETKPMEFSERGRITTSQVLSPDGKVVLVDEKGQVKGSVTALDVKNLLAEISIGTADGVKEGMRFRATYKNRLLYDIVILDVEPERSIGIIEPFD